MRKNIVIISALALLLVVSVVLNVYQFALPSGLFGAEKPTVTTTAPETDNKPTLVELEMMNIGMQILKMKWKSGNFLSFGYKKAPKFIGAEYAPPEGG